jgi:hypothetical protein
MADQAVRLKSNVHKKLTRLLNKLNKNAVPNYKMGDVVEYLINRNEILTEKEAK